MRRVTPLLSLLLLLLSGRAWGAFPTVESVTATPFSSASTTHSVEMPATVNSGDLLLVIAGFNNSTNQTPSMTGFTNKTGNINRTCLLAKIADGTEDGTSITLTLANSATAVAHVWRITGFYGDLAGIEVNIQGAPTIVNPNPASLTVSWTGGEDNLWIASVASLDDDASISGWPTGFTGNQTDTQSGAGENAGCGLGSASMASATDTVDPSNFTLSHAQFIVALTIAIRPAAAGGGASIPAIIHRNRMNHSSLKPKSDPIVRAGYLQPFAVHLLTGTFALSP